MKEILVIGDSHSLVWDYIQRRRPLADYKFIVRHVNGATSQGINNPNSKTNSLKKFETILSKEDDKDYIMISLGEVDCGFAIWYYADMFDIPVEEQLKRSLNAYENFLVSKIFQKYNKHQIILLSSILPTIEDQTNKKFLTGERSKVTASIKKRTDLTIEYNKQLGNLAKKYNLKYIDITEDILDKSTGIVDKKFKHKNVFNHHLNTKTSSVVWLDKFKKCMDNK